jgi:hypothetical protein
MSFRCILIVAMDDFSSSRIREHTTIFSTRKMNAWNATIQRGSITILGGDREMLRNVLNYKRASTPNTELRSGLDHATLAQNDSTGNSTAERHGLVLTSSPLRDEDFHLIQANTMKVLSYSPPSNHANLYVNLTRSRKSENSGFIPRNVRGRDDNSGPIAFVFRTQ